MINMVGILFLILGFFAPYITDGHLPSIVCFWIGGMMFFNKGLLIRPETPWAKWARIGILTNVAIVAVMFVTFSLINGVIMSPFWFWLSRIPYWLSAPATAVGQRLFPALETHRSDGSVLIHLGYLRIVVEDFLNVVTFVLGSVAIGLLRQRRLQLQKS
jgi:hypothetical protein